jgi:hypothetical protein
MFEMSYGLNRMRRKNSDPREREVSISLKVIRAVAAQDADYAKHQNGVGFSKPDSRVGHALAGATLATVMSSEASITQVLQMGKRYRRQAKTLMQDDIL